MSDIETHPRNQSSIDCYRNRLGCRFASDRGALAPFFVIMFVALVGLAGVAFDAGNLFAARREANNIAAAAARAGANDLTEASIYAGDPALAPGAGATAMSFALVQGADTASARLIGSDGIEVTVTRTMGFRFLYVIGLNQATVTGRAEARARDSVSGP